MHDDTSQGTARIRELEAELDQLRQELANRPTHGLIWEQPEDRHRAGEPTPTLTHQPDRDVNAPTRPTGAAHPEGGGAGGGAQPPTHLLIEGDNLDALEVLQHTHTGAVDVIYIDPPYNTGNTHFPYNDRRHGTGNTWPHSEWLAFMDARLHLAGRLLARGGYLAVSIDDNEMAHLKLLLDQHFGEKNVKTIVVKMSELAGVKMAAVKRHGTIPKLKEYVLIAQPGGVRNLNFGTVAKTTLGKDYNQHLNGLTHTTRDRIAELAGRGSVTAEEAAELEAALRDVTLRPARGAATEAGVNPHGAPYENWRRTHAWCIAATTNGGGTVRNLMAQRAENHDLPDQDLAAVVTPTGQLYLALTKNHRTLLIGDDHLDTPFGDIWTDITTTSVATEGGVTFPNGKKPVALLRRIIGAHPNPNATVLDFFAGSGSTLHAVAELNTDDGGARRCILVTNNENNICTDVTHPRARGVLTGNLPDGRRATAHEGTLRYYRCEALHQNNKSSTTLDQVTGHIGSIAAISNDTHGIVGRGAGYTALESPTKTTVIWYHTDTAGLAEVITEHRRDGNSIDVRCHNDLADEARDALEGHGITDVTVTPLDDTLGELLRDAQTNRDDTQGPPET